MAFEDPAPGQDNVTEAWSSPLPARTPAPTYAPAFLALGITFLLFGIVSTYVFSTAGIVLIVWSISKWVGELLDGERNSAARQQ
jgi:hypothetical protein